MDSLGGDVQALRLFVENLGLEVEDEHLAVVVTVRTFVTTLNQLLNQTLTAEMLDGDLVLSDVRMITVSHSNSATAATPMTKADDPDDGNDVA